MMTPERKIHQKKENKIPYLLFVSRIHELAKALDQTVPEYLKETLIEAVENYAQTDMISDILKRELGLKEDTGEIMPYSQRE
jgi:hypothetical protein